MAETVTKRRKPAIARVREENRATSDEELEDDRIETSEEIARDKRSADWAARPVLKISHLRKDFGDLHVLKDVSFEVRKHEVVVLLGPSGSGKSTLMRCVNLLEQVNDGQIFLDGKDITDPRVKDDEVRKHIGVVFQQFNLFPSMTVLRNVTLGAIKVHHWKKDRANDRAMELLNRIGLGNRADAYPDNLSGGQQQRVAICRALMTHPDLLLLDEITSALDPMLVGEVLDMVHELKDEGSTILMSTHEMSFAHDSADRVVLLRDGRVAENGTPREVMDESQDPETKKFFSYFRKSF